MIETRSETFAVEAFEAWMAIYEDQLAELFGQNPSNSIAHHYKDHTVTVTEFPSEVRKASMIDMIKEWEGTSE